MILEKRRLDLDAARRDYNRLEQKRVKKSENNLEPPAELIIQIQAKETALNGVPLAASHHLCNARKEHKGPSAVLILLEAACQHPEAIVSSRFAGSIHFSSRIIMSTWCTSHSSAWHRKEFISPLVKTLKSKYSSLSS